MTAPSFDAFRFVAGNVSRETFDDVVAFEAAFQKWAGRINLVAPSTLSEIWLRHIMDSAQLMRLAPDATKWLDLGSGGGFPGAVIAILLRDRPGASIDLVESNNKKAAFLRTVLAQLQTPAHVHVERIEDAQVEGPQIVTARALAPLSKLLDLTERWLSDGASGLFHKGRDYAAEIKESSAAWDYDLLEHRSVIDSDSVILAISNLRRR